MVQGTQGTNANVKRAERQPVPRCTPTPPTNKAADDRDFELKRSRGMISQPGASVSGRQVEGAGRRRGRAGPLQCHSTATSGADGADSAGGTRPARTVTVSRIEKLTLPTVLIQTGISHRHSLIIRQSRITANLEIHQPVHLGMIPQAGT